MTCVTISKPHQLARFCITCATTKCTWYPLFTKLQAAELLQKCGGVEFSAPELVEIRCRPGNTLQRTTWLLEEHCSSTDTDSKWITMLPGASNARAPARHNPLAMYMRRILKPKQMDFE